MSVAAPVLRLPENDPAGGGAPAPARTVPPVPPPRPFRFRRRSPVALLRIYILTLFIIPTNTVFPPIGGAGFPAGILAIGLMGLYVTWMLMGTHNPLEHKYPTRFSFLAVWLLSLASYLACQFRIMSPTETNGADRWLLMLAGLTGVALVASEGLRDRDEIFDVLRAMVWGGAFCGFVAALQYWYHFDLAALIGGSVPGFSFDSALGGIQARGGLNRVPGTTQHPIELGAVAAMMLPVAIVLAIHDLSRPRWKRNVPVALILICIPVSVSRSAILAIIVAVVVFTVQLSARRRAATMAMVPFAVVAIFFALPGIIATLRSFFLGASTDSSVTTRTGDYPLVEQLVKMHPWLGQGGGTYVPTNFLTIFDNAYLMWVVEFGLVGLVVVVVWYLFLPVMTAVTARRRALTEETSMLAAALGAGLAGAALSALTFDAQSFATFTSLQAFMIGMVGAVWQEMVRQNRAADAAAASDGPALQPVGAA